MKYDQYLNIHGPPKTQDGVSTEILLEERSIPKYVFLSYGLSPAFISIFTPWVVLSFVYTADNVL